MRWLAGCVALLLIVTACRSGFRAEHGTGTPPDRSYTLYAHGFEVIEKEGYKVVQVFDPWQNSRNVTLTYALAGDVRSVPDSLREHTFVRVPVRRVIALSTTHVAMIDKLGQSASIRGISGTGFIYNAGIRERIANGEILEVGYDQALNLETIVDLRPDILFIYGVENSMSSISEKLDEMGVPVVFCGEYLETHPLGKAEWIRFFAQFYGLERDADLMFRQIDSSYQSHAMQAANAAPRPRILTGLPWKGTWYMAGGKSFAARLIEDAGGDYLWKDNGSAEAVPLSLESVYARALDADIWINPGEAESLEQLTASDVRFMELPVVLAGEVYNNDNRTGPSGGNDYWESGTVRPDLVLADLIAVFHPALMTDHQFIYYRKLK